MKAFRSGLFLLLAVLLAGCGGGGRPGSGSYAAPGPSDDPWGPHIRAASARFGVPETWVREVMRQESGGKQYIGGRPTTSSAGAIGLMQVMPRTYEGLRRRYGLGSDPYDPHDNIMAGTAYLREMFDRYGSPGFLAAYNAGPARVDDYLSGGVLPDETVNYVASIAPRLGAAGAASGPLAAYAGTGTASASRVVVADAMQPISSPGDPGVPAPTVVASMQPITSPGDPGAPALEPASRMDPIASPGDPGIPPIVRAVAHAPLGTPLPAVLAQPGALAVLPGRSPPPGFLRLPPTLAASTPLATPGGGGYGIQVGAYGSPGEARVAADAARSLAGAGGAQTTVGTASRPDGSVLFRARLVGMSSDAAATACRRVQANGKPCFVVSSDGAS